MITVHLPYGFSSIKIMGVTNGRVQFGPPGYECDPLYIACLTALALGGSGPFSIDGYIKDKKTAGRSKSGVLIRLAKEKRKSMLKRHGLILERALIVLSLIAVATLSAAAQTYSSSADYTTTSKGEDTDGASLDSSPASGGVPQYGQNAGNGYPSFENRWSHVAFEAGGGFTAPIGNDHPFVTYGYNLTVGGGWNFTKKFGTLVEYQFNRNKIPGATLAVVGAPGGNVNTWSFTVDPIYNYGHVGKWGGYVTGGGGFYRKVTNFTAPQAFQYCDYFYGYCGYQYQNVTIGHFSSNQGGLNIGTGVTWQVFGPDSRAKLYGEARYVWVDSPRASATHQGTGTEEIIPVIFGVRF